MRHYYPRNRAFLVLMTTFTSTGEKCPGQSFIFPGECLFILHAIKRGQFCLHFQSMETPAIGKLLMVQKSIKIRIRIHSHDTQSITSDSFSTICSHVPWARVHGEIETWDFDGEDEPATILCGECVGQASLAVSWSCVSLFSCWRAG